MDALYQLSYRGVLVQGEGFEPPKAEPDDLQSPVFDRFTIPAWSRQRDALRLHGNRLSEQAPAHSFLYEPIASR